MERLNCVNRQLSEENNVSRNVCVSNANRKVQEICSDNCCKISNSHELSSDNLNKTLKPEECGSAYECDEPSGYVFVDVGNDLIGSGYLLEEDDDIYKVSSETVFTDCRDIDYNFVKSVSIERCLKNRSKENEINNYNLDTTIFNISDVCTGNNRSGLSTSACMDNMCGNLENYNKKPSNEIDCTTTSIIDRASGGIVKVNTCVKEETSVEDVLVHQSIENMSPVIKKEEMVYNEEVSILNESVIDIKLHPVIKVEEPPDIDTNYSCVLNENNKTKLIVLSKTVNSGCQEVHTEYSEEVPNNSDMGDVMVLKPLKENETIQSKRESRLHLQNKVQTPSRTHCELQIKPKTSSGDNTGIDGVEECENKLIEEDLNTEAKNKNDETHQHHRNWMLKLTRVRHYVCKVCCEDFTQLCDLKAHKHIHTCDRLFSCCFCGKAFKNNSSLKKHERVHSGDRPFACNICGKAFKQLGHLKDHKSIHTGDKPFCCSTCGKAFIHLAQLKNHKRIHTGDKPYVCSTCGKAFTQLCNLKTHKRIHMGDKPFCCSTCGKAFIYNSELKKHKRIHSGDRPFGCNTCGKAFKHSSALKAHKRTHIGDKPFCCSTCGNTFTQLASLKRHKRIHPGDRLFSCSLCGKAFIQNCELKKHKRIHSGDSPFGCNTCGKAFTQLASLKRHKHIHTGDRPFCCSTCGKAFTQLFNLKRHKRIHTGDRP